MFWLDIGTTWTASSSSSSVKSITPKLLALPSASFSDARTRVKVVLRALADWGPEKPSAGCTEANRTLTRRRTMVCRVVDVVMVMVLQVDSSQLQYISSYLCD
mmetsp:Transcript_15889/g.36346  ORF Transcript_15889/g.36346 Transcript_15889/m.36346 type:complete len:103 (+) Transcript_15889:5323-5631(+)